MLLRRRSAAAALVLVLLTGGCTLDPYGTADGTPTGSASPSTPPATPVSQTPVPERPAADPDDVVDGEPFTGTGADTGQGTGEDVGTLVDLEVSAHTGFDRVVLELDGPDVPGWRVQYVDRAIGDPGGVPVDVAGAAVLQVLLDSVGYPEDGVDPYTGPSTVTGLGTLAVQEVVFSSIFEGELQAFVGVGGKERDFRVYGMTDPARVVIEVRDPLG